MARLNLFSEVLVSGGVYLDGENIEKLDPMWLRTQIGTVSQVCNVEITI